MTVEIENAERAGKTTKSKKIGNIKKLDFGTAKLLVQIKDKANAKEIGRKVKDSEIIAVALKLVGPEEIKVLQESTYSEKDKLSLAYIDYQKTNGKLSMDQFINKLLRGEVIYKS